MKEITWRNFFIALFTLLVVMSCLTPGRDGYGSAAVAVFFIALFTGAL
jgi:hypothetical protein